MYDVMRAVHLASASREESQRRLLPVKSLAAGGLVNESCEFWPRGCHSPFGKSEQH